MIILRNTPVMWDSDVAELYGEETKRVNEAVSNNPDKFLPEYLIRNGLKSQLATSIKEVSA